MFVYLEPFLNSTIFGNTVLRYLMTVLILLAGTLAIKLIIRRLVLRLKKLAQKTISTFDDFLIHLLETIIMPLLYLIVIYLALKNLSFPYTWEKALNYFILGAAVFFGVKVASAFIAYGFKIYLKKREGDTTLEKSLQGTLIVIKILLWAGALIFFLDNLGFKVSAVIAGLGIGGVAVALAAQTILKDLFSYFCILFDHPFKVGDFIVVDDFMGTVEHIGIKTTRLRSLSGELLIFSNSDLTDARLRNYKLMEKRRVVFRIGLVYQTPLNKLKEVPQIIKDIISSIPEAVFERAHFFSYGDFSLIFEVVYYVIGADYNKYMDVQQKINFAIKEEFEKRKIEFAYPTQTILVNKMA
ncbi:MAG: mechanosensitive ion channel [Candidatus Omnitrophica bacterium]|nr:mechanosensitive ion channel [Candidatus Omnitrophota bacterium]